MQSAHAEASRSDLTLLQVLGCGRQLGAWPRVGVGPGV